MKGFNSKSNRSKIKQGYYPFRSGGGISNSG